MTDFDPPCYIRKFFRSFRKNFRSTQELCLGCFFYAYLCIVKAVAARKTGPLTARQTNLRKSIEEMNKQLIKKFKKYLESKSAFYIYLKMSSRGDRYLGHSSRHTQVPVPVTIQLSLTFYATSV